MIIWPMSEKLGIRINQLINRNKRTWKPIVALPNVFNYFFSSAGQKLGASVPPANFHFGDYLSTNNSSNLIFFEPSTPVELKTEILLLPSNTSHGLHAYSCPVCVLKSSISLLSLPLTPIMNTSVTTGPYPSKLKHANKVIFSKVAMKRTLVTTAPFLFFDFSIDSLRKLSIID